MLICMIDSIPELLRWVSTIMGCYQHAYKQVSIEQEWFDVRVAEQSLLPEFCVDNKQGILFRKQGRYSDLGHSTYYIEYIIL